MSSDTEVPAGEFEDEADPIEQLSDNRINLREGLYLLILVASLIVVGYYRINVDVKDATEIFWNLGLTATVGVAIALGLKIPAQWNLNVPISGKPILPFSKKMIILISVMMFLATFFLLSQSQYRVGAPSFSVRGMTLFDHILLIAIFAFYENVVFFTLLPGIIFTVATAVMLKLNIDTPLPAFAAVMGLVPYIFLLYHDSVYAGDLVASVAVFIFGLEQVGMQVLLRDHLWMDNRHIGNNLGLFVFRQMTLGAFFISLLMNMWTWVIIVLVVLGLILWWRSKKGG